MKTKTFTTEEKLISKATLARMPLYLHFLQEESSKGAQYISSTVIAQNISVSSVLVRKDLALVSSEAGRPRLGFAISRLIVDIEKFLGYDNLSDAITALDLSEDDDLLVALLAFSSALESSYGRSADIDEAVDTAVSAIAPIKDRQKSNYQVGEYAVQKLMSIFGLTPAELGRVESGIHGDYDEDEDDDKGTSSGGLGTGELVFGDDGMVLDINSGEFVKYSEILTEYVRLFNEKRQDGLLDELLEKYGDEYLELLYGSGASQN